MRGQDSTAQLQQQVQLAAERGTTLSIVGGNTKAFYGGECHAATPLSTADHCGVIDYEPSELVITARAGTSVETLVDLLAQHGQMLAFEPPRFGTGATLGGTVACGFSGPRRPFAGSARDFTLGCRIINGYGEVLNFGGRVIKNVAGFDVSRLMVGALGTLGVLLEASLKVLPLPECELTLTYEMSGNEAITRMNALAAKPWPFSAMAYEGKRLRVRLSGAGEGLTAAAREIGGDIEENAEHFWTGLREQQLDYFRRPGSLWRISVAPATSTISLSGDWLMDWGGALRWLKTEQSAEAIHETISKVDGYAVCFRGDDKTDWIRFDPPLQVLQNRIRAAFDPAGLFNPGRIGFSI
jgi:glycolate oxidase FAD binding subunit